MPWDRRYFRGDEVWVETDTDGDPLIEDGRVFMKYRDEPDAKVYEPHADNVAETPEEDRENWVAELEERKDDLLERERALDVREQALDDREEALERWEQELKQRGVLGDDYESRSTTEPDLLDDLEPVETGTIEFHTDGACSGNPGPAGFGVVRRTDDDYEEWRKYIGQGTNNIAELRAIESALESVEDRSQSFKIFSDSRYAIGVLTKGWNVNANQELVKRIRELLKEFDDVLIDKVEGHAGDPLNERADKLARGAIPK
ncbi:MAG: RNase H family protein [Bradymonadaceae bacterium]